MPRRTSTRGSPRPLAIDRCGRRRPNAPVRSGPPCTTGCSRELGVADVDGLSASLSPRVHPHGELRPCSTTCVRRSRRCGGHGARCSASCRTSSRGSRSGSAIHELVETFPVRVISGIEGVEKPDRSDLPPRARAGGRGRGRVGRTSATTRSSTSIHLPRSGCSRSSSTDGIGSPTTPVPGCGTFAICRRSWRRRDGPSGSSRSTRRTRSWTSSASGCRDSARRGSG